VAQSAAAIDWPPSGLLRVVFLATGRDQEVTTRALRSVACLDYSCRMKRKSSGYPGPSKTPQILQQRDIKGHGASGAARRKMFTILSWPSRIPVPKLSFPECVVERFRDGHSLRITCRTREDLRDAATEAMAYRDDLREKEERHSFRGASGSAIPSLPDDHDDSRYALADWVMEQKDARLALEAIAEWNRTLGVWCACAMAETCLRLVPKGRKGPHLEIEMAKRWAQGHATAEQVKRIAENEDPHALHAGFSSAMLAGSEAIEAAYTAANLVYVNRNRVGRNAYSLAGTVASAWAYEHGYEPDTAKWDAEVKSRLADLRETILLAIHYYPGRLVASSGGLVEPSTIIAGIIGLTIGAGVAHAMKKT